MDLSDLFPAPKPIISTGLSTGSGVAIGKEVYSDAPRVARGNPGNGQSVGVVKEGRIPVILFEGGFHTP